MEITFERYPLKTSISLAANMREALRTVPMLKQDYERVTVMVDSPVMLAPTDLYDAEQQTELYNYTFSQQDQQAVLSHVLPDLNAVAVFSIHKDLRLVFTDFFGTVHFRPLMVSVWNHFYKRSFTGPRQKLYAYFHDRQLEVISFTQNRFKFYNSYAVGANTNDALYYILSAWKQLGMEAREDELYLAGDFADREQLTEEARKFIKRVLAINPPGEFNRAAVTQIEGMPYDMMLGYIKR